LVEKGYSVDVAERAVFSASWLLWALSGRTLHAEGTRVDTWEMKSGGRPELKLRYQPVLDIVSLITFAPWDSTGGEVTDYAVFGNVVRLRRMPDILAPLALSAPALYPMPWLTPRNVGPIDTAGESSLMEATYNVGSNLPPQTHTIVLALAEEYCKAATGKGCNLPQRVTSITRSGMTWTMLDPGDFLDKGLTGVIPIDQWLTAVNPKHTKQQSRIFDPAMPRLISSTWARVPTSQVTNNDGTTTYFGHGGPAVIVIDDAEPGDDYIDLDTGKTYGAT
jgi:hypothetical protein